MLIGLHAFFFVFLGSSWLNHTSLNCLFSSFQFTAFYGPISSPSSLPSLPTPPHPTPPSRYIRCSVVYGRNSIWSRGWSYQNAALHHKEGVLCIICIEAFSDIIKWFRSSSADNDAHNRGIPLELGDLCKEFIAEDHK